MLGVPGKVEIERYSKSERERVGKGERERESVLMVSGDRVEYI